MAARQGSLELLRDPVAQALLSSTNPARLAYVAGDGTPRCVPIWFHWDGSEVVMGCPLGSPKVSAITARPAVALTIDGTEWPYKALQIRGTATVETVAGVVPEYASAAERYFGPEQGKAWTTQVGSMFTEMARIRVTPEWVGVLDFEARFPRAIEDAMLAAAASA